MNTLVISRNPIVWQSCDGRNSVEEIARSFQRKGRGKVTENFVWLAIDQLNEKGLLEHNIISEFHGQSRRTVLNTIGLVSVTALPVIASIATPTSA